MKTWIKDWNGWLLESGSDRWGDPTEGFGPGYINPKLDRDEFKDPDTRDLFRDRDAERQARRDIKKEHPLYKNLEPRDNTHIMDRDNPERWLRTQTAIAIRKLGEVLKGMERLKGKDRELARIEIDRWTDRINYLKGQESQLKAWDPDVRPRRI